MQHFIYPLKLSLFCFVDSITKSRLVLKSFITKLFEFHIYLLILHPNNSVSGQSSYDPCFNILSEMNILIIGATSGIGNSLYKHYISCGNHLAIMGRRKNILDDLCAANPSNTLALQVDISDINSFNIAFAEATKSLINIDLAIICAGIGELNESLDIKQELTTLSTNVIGWTNVVDTIYNHFDKNGKGHLVTITSVGGLLSTPIAPSYNASKAFQINYTKSLQAKAKKTAITVTEIRPGLVETRMAKGEGLFWVMPLEKVSRQIIKAIDSKKKLCIVTKRWRILNFIVKHFM